MERRGIGIEVLGVPNTLPDDRIVDKLTIHFLRPRHGGGEVQRVLYPTYRQGQALVIFEDPEVAGRVLQQSCHVLEIDQQRFPLQVKAADRPEVDLPLEANLDLRMFPDEEEVHRLLTSCGFETVDSHNGWARVRGTFMMLTAAKAQMEKLLTSQTQGRSSSSSSPIANGRRYSSGAVPKYHSGNGSSVHAGHRSPVVRDRPSYAVPSSPVSSSSSGSASPYIPSSSPEYEEGRSQRRDRQPSPGPDGDSIVVDTDVLDYARRVKKRDIAAILGSHSANMNVSHGDSDMSSVFLSGKGAKIVSGKLQSLLNDLTKTLCTQEIRLADLDHLSRANVAQSIGRYKAIYPKVHVRQMGDTVRLIGPPTDIYRFEQRVLGKTVDKTPAVRAGRTEGRQRSVSASRVPAKRGADGDDATSKPLPVTQRYSPTRYQDERGRGEGAEPGAGAGASVQSSAMLRGRSNSESRERDLEQKAAQEKGKSSAMVKIKKSLGLKPKDKKQTNKKIW